MSLSFRPALAGPAADPARGTAAIASESCLQMLTIVTAAILPIIVNVAVGFVLAKRGFLDAYFLKGFSGITFRFFIPCLLFAGIYRADITLLRLAQYWSGYFIPILLLFVLIALFSTPLFALTTVYANTMMVGIPLVVQTWGDEGLNIAVAVISLNSLTLFFAYALVTALRGGVGRIAAPSRTSVIP